MPQNQPYLLVMGLRPLAKHSPTAMAWALITKVKLPPATLDIPPARKDASTYPSMIGQTLPGWEPELQVHSIQKIMPSVTPLKEASIML